MNPKVDALIGRSEKWPDEMTKLRLILLSCGLAEEIKWGKPCYCHEGSKAQTHQRLWTPHSINPPSGVRSPVEVAVVEELVETHN